MHSILHHGAPSSLTYILELCPSGKRQVKELPIARAGLKTKSRRVIEGYGMLGYVNEEIRSGDLMLWEGSHNAAVVVVIGLWALVYFGTQKLIMRRARPLRPSRWDAHIPEWERAAFVYVLAYPYPLVLFVVVATDAAAARVIAAFVLLVLSSGLLFLLFPTAIRRTREPRSFLLRIIYRLDSGGNCIPSLHSASALLTTCPSLLPGGASCVVGNPLHPGHLRRRPLDSPALSLGYPGRVYPRSDGILRGCFALAGC